MSEYRQTLMVFVSTLAVSALGLTLAANAQNVPSPFAKKGKQAWESAGSAGGSNQGGDAGGYQYPYGGTPAPAPAPVSSPSTGNTYSVPTRTAPSASPTSVTPAYTYRPSSNSQLSQAPTVTLSGLSQNSHQAPPQRPQTQNAAQGYGSSQGYGSYVPASPNLSSGGSPYPVQAQTQTQAQAPAQTPAPAPQRPGASYDYPSYKRAPGVGQAPSSGGAYYPGRPQNGGQYQNAPRGGGQSGGQSQGAYYPQQAQTSYPAPQPNPYGAPGQRPKRSLGDKLGLRNIDLHYEGYVAGGAAGTYFDDLTAADREWREDFVLDGSGLVEVSAITQGGLEYGVAAKLRGQYDPYRRGFGGRVGDCPPAQAGCSGVNDNGTDFALRGHTSRFYAAGADDAKDFQAQLEGAHIFLRSAYGDVTVGRDDGAAYLFSLGAPTLLNVGASNNPVDYTGLDAVKTVNDASGFSEKITYTSPRLLGDTVGVGVQVGVSYALDAEACGVDYCVRGNDDEPAGVLAPELDDIFEAGLALDRKFDNGLSVEATATYAIGSQQSQLAAFDDLKSLGLALELGYGDFVLGGSYLNSNNALADGDYQAYDVGLTWQPNKFGVTLGYGHAEDDNVGLTSDQFVGGVSYDFNEMFRVSTGVQYIKRDVDVFDPAAALVSAQDEDAASVFVEGRITF